MTYTYRHTNYVIKEHYEIFKISDPFTFDYERQC